MMMASLTTRRCYHCNMSKSTFEVPVPRMGIWRWFTHGCFLLLAILAVHFRYERLYADSSYYLLHALDTGLPWVDHERYSLILAELPALIAFHVGSTLSWIILVYSLGHVLWAWLAAVWCLRMGRPELAVAVVLLQFIGQTWLFFSPMMEICYGASAAVVLLGYWQANPVPRGGAWAVWSFLALLLVTSHPEHAITFLVITGVVWLGGGRNWRILLMAFGPLAVLAFIKVFFLSDYEQGKLGNGWNGEFRWAHLEYARDVVSMFLDHFPGLLALALFGWLVSLRRGTLLSSSILLAGAMGVVLAVNTAMVATEASRYNDSAYFPAITLLVILGVSGLPHLSRRSSFGAMGCLIVLVAVRSYAISEQGKLLALRAQNIRSITMACEQKGHEKCWIPVNFMDPMDGGWEWSLPMESLLISKASAGRPVSVITTDDLAFDTAYAQLPDSMMLLRRWEPRSIRSVAPMFQVAPGPYFRLDSTALVP